jgi:DNA-binding beta-propeller fold protein YncE
MLDSVGSEHVETNGIGYETQVKNNILGYGRLTSGLQGSHLVRVIEHGRIGSITGYDKTKQIIGSFPTPTVAGGFGLAFADDNKRIWVSELTGGYIHEIGTTNYNSLGSFNPPGLANDALAISPDKYRLWAADADTGYIREIGTTNYNVIGSFKTPAINPYGLAFANDTNRLWVACLAAQKYIYEIGTTTGNKIGSFAAIGAYPTGLGYVPETHRLWHSDKANDYIYEIGTTTGAAIGSFQTPSGEPWGLTYIPDSNYLWSLDNSKKYVYILGTAAQRSQAGVYIRFGLPFAAKPDVAIAQLGTRNVYIEEPTKTNCRFKASSYPAKAMYMAWGSV